MTAPLTRPSNPKLSEVARHVIYPASIVTTSFPEVRDKCLDMGIRFDRWQDGAGRIILGKRADGKYAATVGGIVLSIPRQVAKTFLVSAIVFALCMLYDNTIVLWTAHRTRTSNETFRKLRGMAGRKKIKPQILAVRSTNGEQEITFRNGSRIMFGAREQGFGRGFTEVDVEVFDEAQILTEKALEDMIAAVNQARHPAGGLVFFMGTPPRPIDPGEVFSSKRAKALAGNVDDSVYVELSADSDADPDDREQWAKANPSFPDRTPVESMMRMRANLPSDDSFLREALGVWDAPTSAPWVVPVDVWKRQNGVPAGRADQFWVAVDSSPSGDSTTVAACGQRSDGGWQVEVLYQAPGVAWVPAWLDEQVTSGRVYAVLIDEQCAALATVLDQIREKRVRVTLTNWSAMRAACAGFLTGLVQGTVWHSGQQQLTYALSQAGKRDVEGGWAWSRRTSGSDITPVVAVTLALWGAQHPRRTRKARLAREGGRVYVTRARAGR